MDVLVDLRVAELLCSRLCHELANPLGAVSNGVELITELGESDPEALALIGDSARAAARRLQFYRLAYGQASGVSADLTLAEAKVLATGVVETNRVRLAEPERAAAERRIGRGPLKLVLNLLVLAGEALPRGGTLALGAVSAAEGLAITVAASGETVGLSEEALAAFQGNVAVDSLAARTAHAYFTGRLAARLDLHVALAEVPGALTFRMLLPDLR